MAKVVNLPIDINTIIKNRSPSTAEEFCEIATIEDTPENQKARGAINSWFNKHKKEISK